MNNEQTYKDLALRENDDILNLYMSNKEGLTSDEAEARLEDFGENIATATKKKGVLYFILNSFKDKFILILIVLAVVDYLTQDKVGAFIILGITVISALIRFVQDYSTHRFNEKLKSEINIYTDVMRDKKQVELKQEHVVPGDIIVLSAGSVVPADLYLLESKDLFINQSQFTGETTSIEKNACKEVKTDDITDIPNICLMGTSVVSGNGRGLVIRTGKDTFIGKMNKKTEVKKDKTTFEEGMSLITNMLIRYMVVICVLVFVIYGLLRNNLSEALLFALSVAVGITPSMLPMIVNVNLTKGSKNLAKKKTLVKNIQSIQNLGSMDILCTDKTGTLTKNSIVLQKYINIEGEDDNYVLKCAVVNSKLSAGFKNLVDKAIIKYGEEHDIDISDYKRIDEIPFDYERKRQSIVVENESKYSVITKGATEEIVKICDMAYYQDKEQPMSKEIKEVIFKQAEKLAREGMQVIALAVKHEYTGVDEFDKNDEKDLTFVGLIAFLDPPKIDAAKTIDKLKELQVTVKVLTGDNQYATETICRAVGLHDEIILGKDIDELDDYELSKAVEKYNVFARMNPLQKERVVKALKKNGHSVGYMGDGVNDAPSLHTSDVGISVDEGTDIAKESSDIILLEQSLDVVYEGVVEGRKVYGNIVKYMKLALSQDFGDVFSIMISSITLPFLPLLPIQMLIQDFIVEISQIGIPYDNVDEEFIKKPHKWDTKNISKFMRIFGIISSITDVLAFLIFWFILGFNSVDKQAYFQTAWFVECIVSSTLIIFYLRTNKLNFLKANPSKILVFLTMLTIVVTIIVPMLLSGLEGFNYVVLPPVYYLYLVGLVVLYAIVTQIVKRIYLKKNDEWL